MFDRIDQCVRSGGVYEIEMTLEVSWDRVGEGPDSRLPGGINEFLEFRIQEIIGPADRKR